MREKERHERCGKYSHNVQMDVGDGMDELVAF